MKIFNTLNKSIDEIEYNEEPVTIYTCGPTVYDYMHIGNLRTFLMSDLVERALRFNGYQLKTVQNITDIDDKIIKRANQRDITIQALAQEFEKFFLEDIAKLNILPKDKLTHATDYIQKMQDFILGLVDKGFAYVEPDGSVYFDISKFPEYGKLSGIDQLSLKTGTRSLSDEYTKEDIQDFALWKAEPKDQVGYASPWGWGRPGWHIECSVMSQENLGENLDIHMGGVDLIFPHHENEIAQSEAKTGKPFVKHWIHGAHILVDGKKMSKSLGNFYRLKDIEDWGIEPLALRYLYLQTHYRQEMNFTKDSLLAAQAALSKLRKHYASAEADIQEVPGDFFQAIDNDLNFPKALAVVWENIDSLGKKQLDEIDKILGLNLSGVGIKESALVEISEEVRMLVESREKMRKEGKYQEADDLRAQISDLGYDVEDSTNGPQIRLKSNE